MKQEICQREQETSAAVFSGTVDPELASHAENCHACSEILLVSGLLRSNSDLSLQERTLIANPSLIWRRAEWRATEHAVRAASRPIRWMTFVACLAFAASPWLRPVLTLMQGLTSSWSKALDASFGALSRIWPATPNEPLILLAGSGTMLILVLSSWFMLREE